MFGSRFRTRLVVRHRKCTRKSASPLNAGSATGHFKLRQPRQLQQGLRRRTGGGWVGAVGAILQSRRHSREHAGHAAR